MIAHRTPESIWRAMGIDSPADADIEVIAYFCGATVKYRTLTNCAAQIVGRGNKAIISVDSRATEERQRFSVAHELGHWLRDRKTIVLSCRSSDLSPSRFRNFETDREAAANRFAVELLMPTLLFREAARNRSITMETALDLRRQFQVSRTAAAIRLIELGSFPSIVVCNGPQGYKWSWRHPELPLSVRVSRRLSKHTQAYRLLADANAVETGPMEVDADDWVDQKGSEDYVVTEDSVRLNPHTVLSLIWWHDEAPLLGR
ncbi:MAG: ImmA/IrrE family metallo-endopeptidase [Anaerolineae bacterium]|nr:ImmA/IrrE family metallo-endopeptidase [Anaerolineae bacterium]